jgi:ferredoxin
MHDDGLAYVRDMGTTGLESDGTPTLKMATGMARVPDNLLDATVEAAEECPLASVSSSRVNNVQI